MTKYYLFNSKTNHVLCQPKRGRGASRARRYRQDRNNIDENLEVLKIASKNQAEKELKSLQDYVGFYQAKQWEIWEEDDFPRFKGLSTSEKKDILIATIKINFLTPHQIS